MKRIIFHVDVNSAFLSWEACYRIHHLGGKQDLREMVSAVGGDQEKRHGIILAKSIPAKKYHIQTGETVVSAKEKCPGLILVPLNYDLYNRSSKALIKLLSEYTDKIEQYSIDEAFLDMIGCWDAPERTAHEIKIECVQNWGLLLTLEFQKINCSQRWLLILQSRTESTLSGNQKFKRRCGRFQ